MSIEQELYSRSESKCELCNASDNLKVYQVQPAPNDSSDTYILTCDVCYEQLENPDKMDVNHWHCLKQSMWSDVAAIKVIAWRILHQFNQESWSQDLIEMLYLDDETLAWAKAGYHADEDLEKHLDCNGVELHAGDTVTIIKDLNVKGANFTAKRGTTVKGISLVLDNSGQIEGRVNGQRIVILTQFVKKS